MVGRCPSGQLLFMCLPASFSPLPSFAFSLCLLFFLFCFPLHSLPSFLSNDSIAIFLGFSLARSRLAEAVHICNPSKQDVEVGQLLQVPGQPGFLFYFCVDFCEFCASLVRLCLNQQHQLITIKPTTLEDKCRSLVVNEPNIQNGGL